jgi:hypothetical protein
MQEDTKMKTEVKYLVKTLKEMARDANHEGSIVIVSAYDYDKVFDALLDVELELEQEEEE